MVEIQEARRIEASHGVEIGGLEPPRNMIRMQSTRVRTKKRAFGRSLGLRRRGRIRPGPSKVVARLGWLPKTLPPLSNLLPQPLDHLISLTLKMTSGRRGSRQPCRMT